MAAIVVRPLMPADAGSAHALVGNVFRGTPYLERMNEVLESALQFEDPEFLCLLAAPEEEAPPDGLVLFGTILGARLATKVHAVVAPDPRVQLALIDAVRETCERSGERLVVCELPNDPPFDVSAVALAARGFREEGRVDDLVRDGVALRLLVWRPGAEDGAR
ncbi:MAG: hypothetical protein JF589_02175 [Gemmatimonadetes bacterium]|nr:hypothetical protein [Gemmatimonadota bacterium]